MLDTGYTKSWRSKYDSKLGSRGIVYLGAIDWLVGNANWRDAYDDGQLIERGQLLVGLSYLSVKWKVSVQTVRTIIRVLETSEFLTSKSTNKGTILTICNYDTYQSNEDCDQQANQQTTNKRVTTNKNDKNTKNNTNTINTCAIRDYFLKFWDMYDLKIDRTKCEKVFAKLTKDEIEKIMTVLPHYVARTSRDRIPGANKTYRKNPATWLNGKCWNDEAMQDAGLFDRNREGF